MNPFSWVLNYYRNFWNVYQLAQNAVSLLESEEVVRPELASLVAMDGGDLHAFMENLKQQTRKPDELIIVQRVPVHPSSLHTDVEADSPFTITWVQADGLSEGAARNLGIAATSNQIVVLTETTISQHDRWLEGLIQPLERNQTLSFCAPRLASSNTFLKLAILPYASEPLLPLVCWQTLAFRKIEWARVGGIPEDVLPFAGWSVFLARLLAQKTAYCLCATEVELPKTSVLKLTAKLAGEEGQMGLFAPWVWQQTGFAMGAVALAGLCVVLLSLNIFIGLFPGLGILLIFAGWMHFWGWVVLGSKGIQLEAWKMGWLALVRFAAYSWGVRQRAKTLVLLNNQAERHLKKIISSHPDRKGVVIYFPTHDWGNMFQRPHQMARQFARAGYLFFYGTRNEIIDNVAEFQPVEPNLFLVSMPAVPPETFRIAEPVILYIGATWHAPMLDLYIQSRSIYDHYDDLQVSGGQVADHELLLTKATVILASSQSLIDAVRTMRADVLFIPNAVDDEWVQRFEPKPDDAPPKDLAPFLQPGKTIIGYSGALAEWFDYPLLEQTARLRPNYEFVLIGINYDHTLDESGILNLSNIHWLGQKPYAQLFQYVWRFDIAMIPFRINEITLATSPIKLYEYFYCRKPVVSTSLPEVVRYNQTFIADTPVKFVVRIEEALKQKTSTEYQDSVQSIARANTWKWRVQQVITRLNETQHERKGRP